MFNMQGLGALSSRAWVQYHTLSKQRWIGGVSVNEVRDLHKFHAADAYCRRQALEWKWTGQGTTITRFRAEYRGVGRREARVQQNAVHCSGVSTVAVWRFTMTMYL